MKNHESPFRKTERADIQAAVLMSMERDQEPEHLTIRLKQITDLLRAQTDALRKKSGSIGTLETAVSIGEGRLDYVEGAISTMRPKQPKPGEKMDPKEMAKFEEQKREFDKTLQHCKAVFDEALRALGKSEKFSKTNGKTQRKNSSAVGA